MATPALSPSRTVNKRKPKLTTRLRSGIASVIPYPALKRARLAQLKLADAIDYYERADREVFFYRAFCLLQKNRITGDYCEFGCSGGMTFTIAYYMSQKFDWISRKLWAIDSFQGLPKPSNQKDEHPEWQPGWLNTPIEEFHAIMRGSRVPRSAYEAIPGFYNETIGKLATRRPAVLPDDIALAYIDCDMYSSTMSVLEFLEPRFKQGMIIACDDYYSMDKRQPSGERQALLEMMKKASYKWLLIPYVQYSYSGMSFVVESREHSEYHRDFLFSY
jgi:O-methyltransferase